MWAKNKNSGFTIVELLIVIVVIGILAAITIVAYNGIQERARLASAKAFESQFRSKYGADATGSWDFSECSGTTVKNSAGPANTDTISGTATWITDTPSGTGCALHFDGATWIDTLAPLGAKYYVKGAWIRTSSASCGSDNIISQAATNGAVTAFFTPGCKLSAGNNTAWSTVVAPGTINDNKWHYVAMEWVNGTMKLYQDGVLVSTAASGAALQNPTGVVEIGAYIDSNTFVGDIANPFVASTN